MTTRKYFILLFLVIIFNHISLGIEAQKEEIDSNKNTNDLEALNQKIRRSFPIKAKNIRIEFRFFENPSSTGLPHLKPFDHTKQRHWFVSFGEIAQAITAIIGDSRSIKGQFYHENYCGASYLFAAKAEIFATLEKVYIKKHIFRIWDYVGCSNVIFYLDEYDDGHYQLRLKKIEGAKYEWDD